VNNLVKEIIPPILKTNGEEIALIPGGFKPPTLGHFYLVNEIANKNEIDKVLVLIGHGVRDGITKEQSLQIWEIYKKYLPLNVTIQISDKSSPVGDVLSIIKNNPINFYYPVVGMRGEEDLKDLSRFDSLSGKYENYKPITVKSDLGVSGTKARKALLGGDFEMFQTFLPTELSQEDKNKIWEILTRQSLNENATYSQHIDYKQQIKDLTKHMLDKGMNIKPLPKVIFYHGNQENAQNFFGKTAYYNPNTMEIVLYTEGRHPKDIVRSFSHEMIHHIQNLENRLGNITTQNTSEDDHLDQIEREAYLDGNITFRNWTDTLQEDKKPKDPFGMHQFMRELLEEEPIMEGRYDKITNQISSDIFKKWKNDFSKEIKQSVYKGEYQTDDIEVEVEAYLSPNTKIEGLIVDGGVDEETNYIQVRFEINPSRLPKFWEEISMNLKDVIRHEVEHLTHGDGDNLKSSKFIPDDMLIRQLINRELLPKSLYFKLEKEVDANLQGMYFRAKKEKRPFKDVIDTYLDAQDITPKEKEEILDIWRSRLKVLNLPKF
jgi:hypothetical protein